MTNHWPKMPRDTLWPLAVSFLADACVALDRADVADQLLDELLPQARLTLRAGYTTNGGPADRCRAAMAELAGRPSLADTCIRDAYELARASHSPLWLALTESTWAWIHSRRGNSEESAAHHSRAREIAGLFSLGCVPIDPPAPAVAPPSPVASFPDGLSAREIDVLALLAAGCTNRQIAEALYISPNTAANHVRAILRKTASANRTEAAAYAFSHGLADAPSPGG